MGWQQFRLEELFDIARGGSPRPIKKYLTDSDDGVNWIKISDATASSKYIYKTKEKITSDGVSRSRLVQEGDFILSNSMSFGRPYIMKTSGCIHDGWVVLSPKSDKVDQDFLFHLLGSPVVYKQFDQLAAGSTVRNLNIGLVSSVKIPLPPLTEQKQIVAILDEAFASIDHARQLAERNLNNACELFDSTLNQIFTQRGDDWLELAFDNCLEKTKVVSKIPKKQFQDEGEYPVISQEADFINGYWDNEDDVFRVSSPVIVFGDHTKVIKYIDFDFVQGADGVKVLKPCKQIFPKYFYYFLRWLPIKSLGYARHFRLLKDKNIHYPKHIVDQKMIAKKLDELESDIQVLDKIYQQKISALDELKQSLLQKAFRRELTSKDIKAA